MEKLLLLGGNPRRRKSKRRRSVKRNPWGMPVPWKVKGEKVAKKRKKTKKATPRKKSAKKVKRHYSRRRHTITGARFFSAPVLRTVSINPGGHVKWRKRRVTHRRRRTARRVTAQVNPKKRHYRRPSYAYVPAYSIRGRKRRTVRRGFLRLKSNPLGGVNTKAAFEWLKLGAFGAIGFALNSVIMSQVFGRIAFFQKIPAFIQPLIVPVLAIFFGKKVKLPSAVMAGVVTSGVIGTVLAFKSDLSTYLLPALPPGGGGTAGEDTGGEDTGGEDTGGENTADTTTPPLSAYARVPASIAPASGLGDYNPYGADFLGNNYDF